MIKVLLEKSDNTTEELGEAKDRKGVWDIINRFRNRHRKIGDYKIEDYNRIMFKDGEKLVRIDFGDYHNFILVKYPEDKPVDIIQFDGK